MRHGVRRLGSGLFALMLVAGSARAEVLTADRAVELALERSSRVIQARADVLAARASLYGAYSGVLPSVNASLDHRYSRDLGSGGTRYIGTTPFVSSPTDSRGYSVSPTLSGQWSVFDLSAIQSLRSARSGMKASHLSEKSARQLVALDTRTRFYEVVRSVRLATVASSALRLAKDDERRVRALFEVGSVSRSDLLKAQVRSSQSQLDSIRAAQTVVSQRNVLAQTIGVPEAQLGEVDTTLAVTPVDVDESALRAEAAQARPDLQAADAELRAARSNVSAANYRRLPAVVVNGSAAFNERSNFKLTDPPLPPSTTRTDRSYAGSIGISMPIFSGMATESRIASAQASLRRAEDARNTLYRDLDAEVHLGVLQYRQALAQYEVASQAVASAEENLKLTQQKYNVGSSTILDLIDAQVQLQRAQSDAVSALATIRVAEAQLNRIRGRE